jgi:glutaredoxin-related protein
MRSSTIMKMREVNEMTHFVSFVVLNKDQEISEEAIENAVYHFSEGREVEPYISETALEVKEKYKKTMAEAANLSDDELLKREYMKKYKDNPTMPIEVFWKDWCGGKLDAKGNALSTWNKESFYDWFAIGGRWDGYFEEFKGALEGNNALLCKDAIKPLKKAIDLMKAKALVAPLMCKELRAKSEYRMVLPLREIFFEKHPEKDAWDRTQKLVADWIEGWQPETTIIVGKVVLPGNVLIDLKDYGWFGFSKNKGSTRDTLKGIQKFLDYCKENPNDKIVAVDFHV